MLIKTNTSDDVIKSILKIRNKITRIWLFRSILSGLLIGLIILLLMLIFSETVIALKTVYFLSIVVPVLIVLIWRYLRLKKDYSFVPEYIDNQLGGNGNILTSIEMHQKNKADSPFFKVLKQSATNTIENNTFIKYKVIESPIELILIVFMSLICLVFFALSTSKTSIPESPVINESIVSELVELEAISKINDDKSILFLISETKNKILNNEFLSISNFISDLDDKLINREKQNQEAKVFIENLDKSNEDEETLKKLAYEKAQKQLMQRNSQLNSQDTDKMLIHLDLDELIELLRKGIVEDEELNAKLQAFIKNNSELKDDKKIVSNKLNNTKNVASDLWVYKKYNPAKIDIISNNDSSKIIDYHVISDKYTSHKHSSLRKRIIAELNNND